MSKYQINGNQIEDGSINIGGDKNKLNPDGIFDMGTHGLRSDYYPTENNDLINLEYLTTEIDTVRNEYTTAGFAHLTNNNVTSTVAVGGIPIGYTINTGTDLIDFIRELISPYVTSSFSGLTINTDIGGTVYEVGTTITVTNAVWTSVNDSESNPPYNITLLGSGFESTSIVTSNTWLADATIKTVVKTTNTSETWTISGYDKNDVLKTRTHTKYWYFRFYLGADPINVVDVSTAQTVIDNLQQSWLLSGKSRTVTCTEDNNNTSNYTYICYAAKFGDLSNIIQNGATPVLGAFTEVGDFNYINSYGITESYKVYKSNALGAFSNNTSLAIT